jgi:hypothetical protein
MILRTDDDIYVVDQRWLGPPGKELPFHPRYAAVGWGTAIYLVLMVVERGILHVPLGFWMVVYTLVAACWLTQRVMRHVNPDRSVPAVARGWWQELRAPRPPHPRRDGQSRHQFRLVRTRISPPPP